MTPRQLDFVQSVLSSNSLALCAILPSPIAVRALEADIRTLKLMSSGALAGSGVSEPAGASEADDMNELRAQLAEREDRIGLLESQLRALRIGQAFDANDYWPLEPGDFGQN